MVWTLPKTWNVGDVLTSTDLNTYVRDNTNYLYGDAGWTGVSAFANGASASSPPPAYRKIATGVEVRGFINGPTGAGQTAFTLPSGYIPSVTYTFPCWNGTVGGTTFVQVIGGTGAVVIGVATNSVWLVLDFDTI